MFEHCHVCALALIVGERLAANVTVRLPGVARQRHTFFASPKKVCKERRPGVAAPCGGSRLCEAKNGMCPKLGKKQAACMQAETPVFFLRQRTHLYPFFASHKRQRQTGKVKVKVKVNSNVNIKSNPNTAFASLGNFKSKPNVKNNPAVAALGVSQCDPIFAKKITR